MQSPKIIGQYTYNAVAYRIVDLGLDTEHNPNYEIEVSPSTNAMGEQNWVPAFTDDCDSYLEITQAHLNLILQQVSKP